LIGDVRHDRSLSTIKAAWFPSRAPSCGRFRRSPAGSHWREPTPLEHAAERCGQKSNREGGWQQRKNVRRVKSRKAKAGKALWDSPKLRSDCFDLQAEASNDSRRQEQRDDRPRYPFGDPTPDAIANAIASGSAQTDRQSRNQVVRALPEGAPAEALDGTRKPLLRNNHRASSEPCPSRRASPTPPSGGDESRCASDTAFSR